MQYYAWGHDAWELVWWGQVAYRKNQSYGRQDACMKDKSNGDMILLQRNNPACTEDKSVWGHNVNTHRGSMYWNLKCTYEIMGYGCMLKGCVLWGNNVEYPAPSSYMVRSCVETVQEGYRFNTDASILAWCKGYPIGGCFQTLLASQAWTMWHPSFMAWYKGHTVHGTCWCPPLPGVGNSYTGSWDATPVLAPQLFPNQSTSECHTQQGELLG